MEGISLIVAIVGRGKGDIIIKQSSSLGVAFSLIVHGKGTIASDVLKNYGFEGPERDIVFLSVDKSRERKLLDLLSSGMKLDKPGSGVAFSISLSAAAKQASSIDLLSGGKDKEVDELDLKELFAKKQNKSSIGDDLKEGNMTASQYDLIVTVVNRGFADEVMRSARDAGAFGGTIVSARGSGSSAQKQFFGITIEPEKDMVIILTEHEVRNSIMEAVVRDAGLSKDGNGICFSLPVNSALGVKKFER